MKSWRYIGCGGCCKFTVKITTKEWLNITRVYGYGIIRQTVDGFYLRKTNDGLCPFLLRLSGRWFCGIQYMKPLACKLWPFRIISEPKYGNSNEACFNYKDREFYIYVNLMCHGILRGRLNRIFISKILPELIEIRMGSQRKQFYSTINLAYPRHR